MGKNDKTDPQLPAPSQACTIGSMTNLINKLNVLVRSSMHNIFGDDTDQQRGRLPSASRLGKNIDNEIAALRQQIDKALDDEDRQIIEIERLQREIADWDGQADQALLKGDEATARYAVQQVQLQQQRLTMLDAELAQHRIATAELIHRVNELEALVAEARKHQQDAAVEDEDDESLAARLHKARQHVQTQEMEAAPRQAPPAKVDDDAVDDDLAQRRARLSQ
jgi:phage shock protein A